MSFYENVFVNVGIMIIIAQELYVLTGLTGLFSLGQSSFVAVGAYTAGMLATRYGLNPYLCVLAGMAAAVVVSFIIGLPSLRLRHVYFSLATIAYCYALQSVLTVSQYFGGSIGLVGIPTLTRWWHVLGAMALTVFVVRNFKPPVRTGLPLGAHRRGCRADLRDQGVRHEADGLLPSLRHLQPRRRPARVQPWLPVA